VEKGGWLVELETMPEHMRLLVEVDRRYGIHRLVKDRTSRVLRQESAWRATAGDAPLDVVKRHVDRRYRLKLTAEQAAYAQQVGDDCRTVWNTGLEQRRLYRQRGAWINYPGQARQLAKAKTEQMWLKEVPGHCLKQTLTDGKATPQRHLGTPVGVDRSVKTAVALSKGWHRFELALASAARYTGTRTVKVDARYTSQTCFACVACQYQDHADVNAAKNIFAAGLAVTACGDLGVSRSLKQEPAVPRGTPRQSPRVGIPRL